MDTLGTLAFLFHFQPSELRAMTVSEIRKWSAQAERIARERRRANGSR